MVKIDTEAKTAEFDNLRVLGDYLQENGTPPDFGSYIIVGRDTTICREFGNTLGDYKCE